MPEGLSLVEWLSSPGSPSPTDRGRR
jgi:hypothetical protein